MYDSGMELITDQHTTSPGNPTGHPTQDCVEGRLAEIAGQLNVLNAEIIGLTATAITDRSWCGYGIHSPAQWLTIQLGISPAHAKQIIEIAERSASFPTIIDEFASGTLSIDQTHVVVTRAPAWADNQLVNIATSATVAQLHRLIRNDYFEGPDTPDPTVNGHNNHTSTSDTNDTSTVDTNSDDIAAAAGSVHVGERDRVSFGWNGSRFTGTFDVSADTGAIIEAALNETHDALFDDGVTDVTWVDALREIALRSLDHTPTPRRNQFTTMLHINIDDPAGHSRFSNGVPLPAAIREYLTCDIDHRPVWETDNTAVGVGRTQRTIPTRLRNLITYRDQGCQIPGCTATHIEIHHIQHWADGGNTETSNLISLCARHHRAHHQGLIGITGNPNQPATMVFTDRHRTPINTTPRPIPPTGPPPTPQHRYQHPTGERLNLTHFAGWTHPLVQQRHTTTWHHHQQRRTTETSNTANTNDDETHEAA